MKTADRKSVAANVRAGGNRMTERDKAAFILGIGHAFVTAGWPKHFSEDDVAGWLHRLKYAAQMLGDGVFNPFDAWSVEQLADEELTG